MYKRFLSFTLTAMLVLGMVVETNATTLSDVQSQKNKTQNNLTNVNSQIEQMSQKQEELKEEVQFMDTQLVDILTSISICKDEIVAKEEEVVKAKDELKVAQSQEQEQYDAMKQRIRFMYEKGDNAYLQIFLQSKSLSEMINKAGYVEKLYTYDRELLDVYTVKKEETKEKKQLLEEEEAELLAAHYELEQEQQFLEELIDEKKATISNFDTQLANAQAQVEVYKKELKRQTQQLRELEAEEKKKQEAAQKAAKEAEEAAKASTAKSTEEQDSASKDTAANQSSTDSKETTNTQSPTGTQDSTDTKDTTDTEDSADSKDDTEEQNSADHEETKDSADEGGNQETTSDKGNATLGQQIADYAKQFVGNPYRFGGTSLTNGTDCSGFTMSVYAHFGITIPRDSTSQRSAGRAVSYAEAQAGDIICYAGHVGLYIGNGQIVHASTEATGIKYSNATYRTILAVRRIV